MDDSIQALAQIGINVEDSAGKMKSVTQILNELHDKWNSLTDAQRQQIGVTIAGREQLSRFLALMNNYDTALAATETAINSQNSAVIENEKYQQSLEARLNRLSTAWQALELQIGDKVVTDSLIALVGGLQDVISIASKVINIFGVLPTVIFPVSTAVILLSNNLRKFATDLIVVGGATKLFTINMEAAGRAVKALASATIIGGILSVISLGVEKLIEHFGKARQEQEKEKQEIQDLTRSYSQNKDQIEQLVDRYEALSAAVSKGDLSKNDKEYLEVQQKLYQLLPSTAASIDQNGQAHLKSADAIRQEIKALDDLSKIDAQKFVNNFSDKLNEINKKISETQRKIDDLNKKQSNTNIAAYEGNPNPGLGAGLVNQQNEDIQLKADQIVAEREYQALLAQRVQLFQQLASQYAQSIGVENQLTQADYEYINALIEHNKKQLATADGTKKVESQVRSLVESLSILRSAFGKGFNLDNLGLDNTNKIIVLSELVKGYEAGGESIQKFTQLLQANGFTEQQVAQITDALTQSKRANAQGTDYQAQAEQTLQQILKGSLSLEDTLAKALLGYTQQQIDENTKLIEIYTVLSKAENLSAQQKALLAQVTDELSKRFPGLVQGHSANISAIYNEINAEQTLYQAVVASAQGQLDAEHQKTLGMALELQNQKKIIEQQINLYKKSVTAYMERSMAENNGMLALNGSIMAAYRKMNALQADVDNVYIPKIQKAAISLGKYLNIKPTFKTPSWDFSEPKVSSSGKKSKSKKDDFSAQTKVDKYVTDKFSQSLEKLQLQIKQSQERMEHYSKTSANYRKELNNQIKLIQQEESLTKKQIATLEKKNESLKKQLKHMGNFNKLSNEQKQKYNEIAQAIDENIGEINDLQGSLVDYASQIRDIQDQIKQIYSDVADEIVDIYKDAYEKQKEIALDANQKEMDALEKSHEKKMEMYDDELNKYEEIVNAKLKEIDRQEDEDSYQKELAQKQKERQQILDEINKLSLDDSLEAQKKLAELKEQLAEKDAEIQDFTHQHEVDLRKQNLQDNLDAKQKEIDAKKDAEDQKYEAAKAELEKERDEINKYWDNILNDERQWTKLREDIMKGHFANITKQLEVFKKTMKSHMGDIGKSIAQNLIDKINEAEKKLKELSGSSSGSGSSSSNGSSGSSGSKGSSGGSKGSSSGSKSGSSSGKSNISKLPLRKKSGGFPKPKSGWNLNSVVDYLKSKGYYAEMSDREKLYKYFHGSGDYKGTTSQNAWLLKKLKAAGLRSGGYTGDWPGDSGKIAILHKKELVLNKDDTKNFLEAIDVVRHITPLLPNLIDIKQIDRLDDVISKAKKMNPFITMKRPIVDIQRTTNDKQKQMVNINMPIRIDRITGDKDGAQQVFQEIANSLKKRGMNLFA